MSSFTFTEIVRLAQIGVEGWGRNRLRALEAVSSADVVVLGDPGEDALAAAGRRVPSARTTTRTETVVADAAVDAVVIAGVPGAVEIAEACLEAGKHVFLDAPLAPTAEAARRLVALAADRDLRLMVGHVLRYHPAIRHLEGLVESGELGAVRTAAWHLGGVRPAGPASVLDRLGPSALSTTLALLRDVPRAVTAQAQSYAPDGAADVVLLAVTFRNGSLAHLHLSRIDARKTRQLSLTGSRGLALFDDMRADETLRLYDLDDADAAPPPDFARAARVRSGAVRSPYLPPTEPLVLECREFVAAIRERRPPRTDGADGLAVVRLLEAARQSAENGGAPVPVT